MKNLKISQIVPLAGYVLVEPAKAETKTASGIILPENEGEKPQYGTVLAVGSAECECDDCGCGSCGCGSCGCGCGDECGCEVHEHAEGKHATKAEDKSHSHSHSHAHDHDHNHEDECDCDCGCGEAPVEVGDQVIYKKWGGNEVTIDDVEYQFLKFEDILAIISKK